MPAPRSSIWQFASSAVECGAVFGDKIALSVWSYFWPKENRGIFGKNFSYSVPNTRTWGVGFLEAMASNNWLICSWSWTNTRLLARWLHAADFFVQFLLSIQYWFRLKEAGVKQCVGSLLFSMSGFLSEQTFLMKSFSWEE